jgi:hypothetical protein
MKVRNLAPLAAALAMLTAGIGSAHAALVEGTSPPYSSSVFISLAERNNLNQVVRNLVIDTGSNALATFAGTPWSTTAAEEAAILSFVSSTPVTSRIVFNVGGALTDQSFATDSQGFLTTGNATGPAADGFAALGTAITNTVQKISNSNTGTFTNGVLTSNGPSDPGFHGNQWGDDYGGAIQPSNELLLGAASQLIGWKTNQDFVIIRSVLGSVTSNLQTGDISFAVVPVPAAIWLLGSAFGTLGCFRRKKATELA